MKVHILSDLHIEFENFALPETDSDVVILAGDTSLGTRGVDWVMKNTVKNPVIYLAGNHEFYKHAYPKLLNDLIEKTNQSNVHFLENQSITIGDIRILGCTLWTDFLLYNSLEYSMYRASQTMNDYKLIRKSPAFSRLRPQDTALIHAKSVNWLKNELSGFSGKTVVVTHHAPSLKSVPKAFYGHDINPCYCSDLENLIREFQPELWIHGHIHTPCDYFIGKTHVICNPKGYPSEFNSGFNRRLVIEI
jgi:Icc-related predicted phosphoesterase